LAPQAQLSYELLSEIAGQSILGNPIFSPQFQELAWSVIPLELSVDVRIYAARSEAHISKNVAGIGCSRSQPGFVFSIRGV
jgi:hypothetical protein